MSLTQLTSLAAEEPLKCPSDLNRTNSPLEHLRICHSLIARAGIDSSLLAWVFVYLRLLGSRRARRGMRANYQTKDISHMQDVLSLALARAYAGTYSRGASDGAIERALIRSMVAHVPRGGGNGDELRLFILDVMRRHGIREGHRPGIDDPFLEQWHQKLHSGSTPEDIAICEAYIAFQESGSHQLFFDALWERGRLVAEDLSTMPRPLTHLPRHMPELIPDLRHMLWILKQIHAGSDNLHYLIEVSRWQLDAQTTSLLECIRDNFGNWWVPGKVVQARQWLESRLSTGTPRDPLMLDVALDGIFKSSIERLDLRAFGKDDLTELIGLALENLALSCDHDRIGACCALWERVRRTRAKHGWSRSLLLRASAALSSLQLLVQDYSDLLHRSLQPRAQELGERADIEPAYVTGFAEEVIRSHGVFCLAKLIDALAPVLREAAGLGAWRIVSRGDTSVRAKIAVARSLSALCEQETPKGARRIAVVDEVDGTEDLADWVAAVVTPSDVDVLSHVAIRARAGGVLLATCYDQHELSRLRQSEAAWFSLQLTGESVALVEMPEPRVEPPSSTVSHRPGLARTTACRSRPSAHEPPRSKSANLALIAERLPGHFEVPLGVTLDADMFAQALANSPAISSEVRGLESNLCGRASDDRAILRHLREIVAGMPVSESIVESVRSRLIHAGVMSVESEDRAAAVCRALPKVWASLWNERAHWSRVARGIARESVRMGALIQKAIPAEQAFVVHTRHPVLDDPEAMLVEIVIGLGETLASNSPGAPLRATFERDTRTIRMESYPSKAFALRDSSMRGTWIVRSDCNDEDQRGFSGAGLYDSFLVDPPSVEWIDYATERLLWDEAFQRRLIERIVDAAEAVENVMGAPQDIEGASYGGRIWLVQTRDQAVTTRVREPTVAVDPFELREAVS